MVVNEFYRTREDGVDLFRNYSDQNVYIKQDQTGIEYAEAIDVENAPYTYTETDVPIEPESDLTVNDTLEILNEFGVDTSD